MVLAVVVAQVAMAIPGLQEGLVLAAMAHGRLVLAAAVVALVQGLLDLMAMAIPTRDQIRLG